MFGNSGGSEVVAVGAGGVICRRYGTGWSAETSDTSVTLRSGVYLPNVDNARLVVGDGGTILSR